MNKIFADSEEKYVKSVVLYLNPAEFTGPTALMGAVSPVYIYADQDYTQKIDRDTLVQMFVKERIVVEMNGGSEDVIVAIPMGIVGSLNYAMLIITDLSEGTTINAYSEEYTGEVE